MIHETNELLTVYTLNDVLSEMLCNAAFLIGQTFSGNSFGNASVFFFQFTEIEEITKRVAHSFMTLLRKFLCTIILNTRHESCVA